MMPVIRPPNAASLPAYARSPINHCNLPAVILGSLTFQQQPTALFIDGVKQLHKQIFSALDLIADADQRALHFQQYMRSAFLLDHSEQAGYSPASQGVQRHKADYLRLLRGWMFNADGVEAAVLKRWVESRFGLLPRSHRGPLADYNGDNYAAYQADYCRGLYNSNALEAQLDVLYSFCQYEIQRRWPERHHWQLYRGVNQIHRHDVINTDKQKNYVLLLNNLNSYSCDPLHCESFGDYILQTLVPSAKLVYLPNLLPGVLKGEQEYLVIGGVYQTKVSN